VTVAARDFHGDAGRMHAALAETPVDQRGRTASVGPDRPCLRPTDTLLNQAMIISNDAENFEQPWQLALGPPVFPGTGADEWADWAGQRWAPRLPRAAPTHAASSVTCTRLLWLSILVRRRLNISGVGAPGRLPPESSCCLGLLR
jgi:hypothetical protein